MTNSLTSQSLRKVRMTVAALAVAASASVSAQTVITPDLMAPASAYDTAKKGMVIRAHQINMVRSPGDQNSLENVQKELAGGFGPSLSGATNGPLTGGLWSTEYVNYALDPATPVDGDPDWFTFSTPTLAFQGIVTDTNVVSVSTFAYELVTYLQLPAGNSTLVVGSGDSFRLTIGVGDNPFDFTATQPNNGAFSGSRAYGSNNIPINVQTAGVYPVRIVYGQGGGTAGLQFYSQANLGTPEFPSFFPYLINDPNGFGYELTSYQPASLPITPSKAFVSLLSPYPGQQDAFPSPTIRADITSAATTVNTNTIAMKFDGAAITPTITQTGNVTYTSYKVPELLAPSTPHSVSLSFTDSAANTTSNSWTFETDNFLVIPASYSYPTNSGDVAAKGFSGKVNVARANAGFTSAIASTDQRLDDLVIDPSTGQPFSNLVQTVSFPGPTANTVNDDGTYTRNAPINYSMDNTASAVLDNGRFNSGNGNPDTIYLGCPGATDATRTTWTSAPNLAWAEWTWVELPEGLLTLNMGHFDAGQVAIHANDPRDIFRESVILFDSNGGNRTDSKLIYVQQAGIYGFRCASAAFGTGGNLWFEFYVSNPFDASLATLIGDLAVPTYPAYTQLTVPTRPYIAAVSPGVASSGAAVDAGIEVDVVNMGSETPVMRVNGQVVSYSTSGPVDGVTKLTYTPDKPFKKAAAVTVSLDYGNTTSVWNFFTTSGFKALVLGNEEASIRERLAAVHKLDVTQIPDTNPIAPELVDTNYLAQFSLVWNSQAVNSGNVIPVINTLRTNGLAVPVINVEQGNVDELFPGLGGNQTGINANYWSIIITHPESYLAGGLSAGTNSLFIPGGSGGRWHRSGTTPAYAVPVDTIGTSLNGDSSIWGVLSGTDNGSGYVFPARRVQFAIAGPDMIKDWNDNAWALFDAAVEWMLPPRMETRLLPGGMMELGWTSEGQLQETTSLSGTWGPSANQNNPQVINPSGMKFYRVVQ